MDFLISYILFIVHPSPNDDKLKIAPDVAVRPGVAYVPKPPNPGPPSDTMVH